LTEWSVKSYRFVLVLAPALLPILALQAAPPAPDGAALFRQACSTCHAIEPGRKSPLGPNLLGVVGRKAGSGDYAYSPAMKNSKIVWDQASIESYLAAPLAMVPGGKMTVAVPNQAHRAALSRYLATVK
jgi:cytochrome c